MIKIEVTDNKNKIYITGHAQPNVCAAVSSIMYTTVNLLDKYDTQCYEFEDNTEEDYVEVNILKYDNIIKITIDNMLDMYRDLNESHPDDVLLLIES